MNRKQFIQISTAAGLGCCSAMARADEPKPDDAARREREFVTNWFNDLFEAIDTQLDQPTKVRLMASCGKGCFNRHQFKRDIAKNGAGSVDKLFESYKKNFEVWREPGVVHVRYGETNAQCYCPAARYHAVREHDIHCECTRATHQAIFETALGREVKVEIVESLRRGGKTCHFIAHVA